MAKTRNSYVYPILPKETRSMSFDESPAHIDALKYSVDFIVPINTPIRAAADGQVIEVKSDSDTGGEDRILESFGNYIEIQHAHGEYSEYEHLRKGGAVVRVGDRVHSGQVIGYTGGTGWLAHLGPHLHFMVGRYLGTDNYETLEVVWNKTGGESVVS